MEDETVRNRIRAEIALERRCPVHERDPTDFRNAASRRRVTEILSHLGVSFTGVNALEDDAIRQGVKKFSNGPTIPQLYVKGEFAGGCDIVREMYQSGELQKLLQDKGVTVGK